MTALPAFRADLEGLRGAAVLAVVLFHVAVPGVSGGYVGVDVFFVLSGFLITGLLWDELARTGRVSLTAFWARRARRLLPASLLVLAVTVAASVALLSPLRARGVLTDAVAAALYGANYRFAAQSTDYLADSAGPSPLLHFWSLGVEEQFYLLWPLLLLLAAGLGRRSRGRLQRVALMVGLAAVASFALCLWLTEASQPWAFFSAPTRAWQLALGGALALALPVLSRVPAAVATAVGWAGLCAVGVAAFGYDETSSYPGVASLLPVGGAAAVIAAGVVPTRFGVRVLLDTAPLRAAGRISYSWYLWHWPVLVLAAAVAGPLPLTSRLALAAGSALLAAATLEVVENPVRRSVRLAAAPRLVLGATTGATAFAAAAAVVAVLLLPVSGHAPAAPDVVVPAVAVARTQPAAREAAASTPREDPLQVAVRTALAESVVVRRVPRNLRPSLSDAADDLATPFRDGCHVQFVDPTLRSCVYGDASSPTTVALLGDSHATHWFPSLERAADEQSWRLLVRGMSTCPPLGIRVWHPALRRPYRECARWERAVLEELREEQPDVVVLGLARHYGPEWRFAVHSREWLDGLRRTVAALRATGADVLVTGATPWPRTSVPGCLADHLDDVAACTFTRAAAVDAEGQRAERRVVAAAGGRYLDVSSWLCAEQVCPVVVGNLLLYRDDNHVTTHWARLLAPVFAREVQSAMARPRALPPLASR